MRYPVKVDYVGSIPISHPKKGILMGMTTIAKAMLGAFENEETIATKYFNIIGDEKGLPIKNGQFQYLLGTLWDGTFTFRQFKGWDLEILMAAFKEVWDTGILDLDFDFRNNVLVVIATRKKV